MKVKEGMERERHNGSIEKGEKRTRLDEAGRGGTVVTRLRRAVFLSISMAI